MKAYILLACVTLSTVLPGFASDWPDRTHLPIPLPPFQGKIGKTYQESEAAWQNPVAAR